MKETGEMDGEDATEAGTPEAAEGEFEYYRQRPLQVWLILGGVAFVVAVAVLLVYQTGDKKTILTKKDLQPSAYTTRAPAPSTACPLGARNCPTGGAILPTGDVPVPSVPLGASPAPPLASFLPSTPPQAPMSAQPAVCPRCGGHALPLCDRCNAIMLPLEGSLFYCPHCGAVGAPPCPYCGARMTHIDSPAPPAAVPLQAQPVAFGTAAPMGLGNLTGTQSGMGGQFTCPRCNATGLPNWSASGTPLCPSCSAPMVIQGSTAMP